MFRPDKLAAGWNSMILQQSASTITTWRHKRVSGICRLSCEDLGPVPVLVLGEGDVPSLVLREGMSRLGVC